MAGPWAQSKSKDHGRIETRTCDVTEAIGWLPGKANWRNPAGIGMILSERQVGTLPKSVENMRNKRNICGIDPDYVIKALPLPANP
ncbi:MAG: hypothetical protein J7639_03050 [Paenibacillaceae bacterium]|nr:hypothetical protein [Paenibacillaceae bacterium]